MVCDWIDRTPVGVSAQGAEGLRPDFSEQFLLSHIVPRVNRLLHARLYGGPSARGESCPSVTKRRLEAIE